eukprot:m.38153 g.38153  ORF g.38153 m.38153 type:complete len:784 (+) comp10186_c0_seq1:28-2379(+)
MSGFIMTIDDGDDAVALSQSSSEEEEDIVDNGNNEGETLSKKNHKKEKKLTKKKTNKNKKKTNKEDKSNVFDDEFEFHERAMMNVTKEDIEKLGFDTSKETTKIQSRIDLLLHRRQLPDTQQLEDDIGDGIDDATSVLKGISSSSRGRNGNEDDEDEDEDALDKKARELFFAEKDENIETNVESFSKFKLCRPLLVALTNMGISKPSPIQAATLPTALAGKDMCACAPTGSGKTAAFLLPTLQRLFYKPAGSSLVRVVILSPTRELATQVWKVANSLCAKIGSIKVMLVTGGRTLASEKAQLREQPDVIVATPGRLVDHILNTPTFGLQHVDILILDEADRLLEIGFKDAIETIVRACPVERQSMLFSATMTDKVNDLVSLSLKRPHYIDLAIKKKATDNLIQEFIRIRPEHEDKREAIVLSLCKTAFTSNCLVFVRSKRHAHRLRIIFGLAGIKAGELHGSLTQVQRLESLNNFTAEEIDVLICSDLAGRGLDIPGVKTVINLNMPSTIKQYIHRVGRTARAGKSGRSISLVGDDERKLMRELYKANKDAMRNRTVKASVVVKFKKFIDGLSDDIKEILKQEAEEAELLKAEMEERRARNLIQHHDEIMARAPRTWIQTKEEKKQSKDMSKRAHEGDKSAMLVSDREGKQRREKLIQRLQDKMNQRRVRKKEPLSDEHKAQLALAREVKRNKKPKKMHVFNEKGGPSMKKKGGKRGKDEFGFDVDLASTSKKAKTQAGPKSSLLKKKTSTKKRLMEEKSKEKKKPKSQQGHKFKSKKRYKRR